MAQRHVVFMNWRDTSNPEGGGSEVFVEHIARGLVARGHRVTIVCAAHDRAPRDEVRDGIRFVRRGSKVSVYARGWWLAFRHALGHVDLYVDVQNGLPFFVRLAGRTPVIVLVHHVHKEQWPVVYPGLAGRVGWWLESTAAPRAFAGAQYIAVSRATRSELVDVGVRADHVAVVHNGSQAADPVRVGRSDTPLLVTLGRLVPHKQVEHAIDSVEAILPAHPDLELVIAGDGWWREQLTAYVAARGLQDHVTLTGFIDEPAKNELLARAWVLVLPSLKEGWGLVVGEAAHHGIPAVAYRSAGGTTESIQDEVTGLLAVSQDDFVSKLARLVKDDELREHLGAAARHHADGYTWEHATESFDRIIEAVVAGRRVCDVDPR